MREGREGDTTPKSRAHIKDHKVYRNPYKTTERGFAYRRRSERAHDVAVK
jgi:hypothetical protein